MKKIMITILVLFTQTVFSASQSQADSAPESELRLTGFREFSWGDPVSKHENKLTVFQEGEGFTLYTRKDEVLSLGNAKLTALIYSFRNGKFSGVVFYTKELPNKKAVIALLDQTLSNERRKPGSHARYASWISNHVNAGIKCGTTNICQTFYTSKKIK